MELQEQRVMDFEAGGAVELLFNPSVPEAEERRLWAKLYAVYALFKFHCKIGLPVTTKLLIEAGRGQYNTRLSEFRRALIPKGYCVDRIGGEGDVHRYKVVRLEVSTYFRARYEKLAHLAPVGFRFEAVGGQ